jgi:hypothetical protein
LAPRCVRLIWLFVFQDSELVFTYPSPNAISKLGFWTVCRL